MVLGSKGEKKAAKYLKEQGYKIIKKNYRCHLGELDIIANENNTLVFIEVRSRSSTRFGLPEESVTKAKQDKIKSLALYYLQSINSPVPKIRFDVIALKFSKYGDLLNLNHIKNAF
ncbi:MAG: YraN family protein [Clostridiales bacterium]|nr:YraN family protein [Clostridiales bacterium]MCF8022628.1 YraN family protein [Clostridiales bacterium]